MDGRDSPGFVFALLLMETGALDVGLLTLLAAAALWLRKNGPEEE